MHKLNCWEFMKCGKEEHGEKLNGSGPCPVSVESSAHGLNGGVNGGRICWVITDILHQCDVNCSHVHHKSSCFSCEFRYKVTAEEGLINVCRETGALLNKSQNVQFEVH